jgi:hypothetical protein
MLLLDIDALLHYYSPNYYSSFDTSTSSEYAEPVSISGNCLDMAKILAQFTLLLINTDAIMPHILNLVWGANDNARIALGGLQGDLVLIRRRVLALSKIAINTIHIWMTDSDMPILASTLPTFQKLLPSFKQLLLHTSKKVVYARKPVPSERESTKLLTDNLCAHIYPDNSLFENKAM